MAKVRCRYCQGPGADVATSRGRCGQVPMRPGPDVATSEADGPGQMRQGPGTHLALCAVWTFKARKAVLAVMPPVFCKAPSYAILPAPHLHRDWARPGHICTGTRDQAAQPDAARLATFFAPARRSLGSFALFRIPPRVEGALGALALPCLLLVVVAQIITRCARCVELVTWGKEARSARATKGRILLDLVEARLAIIAFCDAST